VKSSTPITRTIPDGGSGNARMSLSIAVLAQAHGQRVRQPGSRAAGQGQGDTLAKPSQLQCRASVSERQFRDLLRESPFDAPGVVAEEAPEGELDDCLLPADRRVGDAAYVPAVDPTRGASVSRARRDVDSTRCRYPQRCPEDGDGTDVQRRQVGEQRFSSSEWITRAYVSEYADSSSEDGGVEYGTGASWPLQPFVWGGA
jgi:hypothetical protein